MSDEAANNGARGSRATSQISGRFYDYFVRIDLKLDRVIDEARDLKARLSPVEIGLANIQLRLDRIDVRLDYLERRFDLRDHPEEGRLS
jgi:hypothetical protein